MRPSTGFAWPLEKSKLERLNFGILLRKPAADVGEVGSGSEESLSSDLGTLRSEDQADVD